MKRRSILCGLLVLVACGGPSVAPELRPQFSLQLSANDSAFTPESLQVRGGVVNSIKVINFGQLDHNFSQEALGIDTDIPAGQSRTITFTPENRGTIEFFCKYHFGTGMKGTLTVS